MSHFSVLVIRDPALTLEQQLQPFHEYESTGTDDEFVQDVDITEEALKLYLERTTRKLRDPEGALHCPYDDRFYRVTTAEESKIIGRVAGTGGNGTLSWHSRDFGDGRGYSTRVRFVPEGWAETEIPTQEAETFAEFIEGYYGLTPKSRRGEDHKYGWIEVADDGSVIRAIDRTNPNKKWDWWQIGGRYTGKFKLKAKAIGTVGRPGLMTEEAPPGYADQARKGDIDLEQMRVDAEIKARALWRSTREITGGLGWDNWEDTRSRYPGDIKRARDEYAAQPAIVLLKASGRKEYSWEVDCELALDEAVYVQRRRDAALSAFAFLRDGIWTERGSMGWFACVSDEMSQAQWQSMFNDMIDALPDDTLLTVVDCHI